MRSILLFALPWLLVAGPTTPLTVVLDFEHESDAPLTEVHRELQKLLSAANLVVELRLKSELDGHSRYGSVVLFKMRGFCSPHDPLPVGALSDERGPLAMAYVADGDVLPFGEVECDRIRKSISRLHSQDPSRDLGIALARVMAHEIYHILSESEEHTRSGVTKSSLSAHELTDANLTFPKSAIAVLSSRSLAK